MIIEIRIARGARPDPRDQTIRRLTSELDAAREEARERYDRGWVDGRTGKQPNPEA